MRLDAPDELLHRLERAPMTKKQINEGGESPVIINRRLGPGLVRLTATRGPSPVCPTRTEILPWPSTLNETRGNPLDTIEGALNR